MFKIKQVLLDHWQLIGLTALIYALWGTNIIWPLRILVVLFHEMSHAAAALLTGGGVESISFGTNEGGIAWTRGGNRFLVSTAGYLGSLIIGAGLFVAAISMRADRSIAAGLGTLLILTSVIYIRDLFPFAFAVGLGLLMIGVAWKLPAQISDLILRVFGLVSMLYIPWDILVDTVLPSTFQGQHLNDAQRIAAQTGLSEGIVGVIWFAIAIGVIFATLRRALRYPSNIVLRANPDTR